MEPGKKKEWNLGGVKHLTQSYNDRSFWLLEVMLLSSMTSSYFPYQHWVYSASKSWPDWFKRKKSHNCLQLYFFMFIGHLYFFLNIHDFYSIWGIQVFLIMFQYSPKLFFAGWNHLFFSFCKLFLTST